MKFRILPLIAMLGLCSCRTVVSKSDWILMKKDLTILQGCPPSLLNCETVHSVQSDVFNYKIFTYPKLGDPKDAEYGVTDVLHTMMFLGEEISLPFTLGEALKIENLDRSEIIWLEPVKVIAIDSDGNRWLIQLRRQDSKTTITSLSVANAGSPELFYEDLYEPIYTADDHLLRQFLTNIKQDALSEP